MNKLFVFIIVFIFLNNCSLNENSRIWKAKNKDLTQNESIKKLFVEEKIKSTEFNPELAINITKVNSDSKEANNRNDNLEYLWRVRFIELAENQARSVCAELWTSGLSCIPLPSGNKS